MVISNQRSNQLMAVWHKSGVVRGLGLNLKSRTEEGCVVTEIPSLAGRDSATVKITALISEMDTIHFANTLYWQRGATLALEGRAGYQRRQDRLETIRNELHQLRLVRHSGEVSPTAVVKPSPAPIATS
jgi:hypothetical protein